MKNSFKKSLALFLAAVMLFAASPIIGLDFSLPASAADESDLTFDLINNDTEYEVSYCYNSAEGELIIPATYNGKPVTSIGYAAFYCCENLTDITIPDSVTSIGYAAFSNCTGLKSIIFGENSKLESIDEEAFSGCESLASITIPASVTSIGVHAFVYCTNLAEMNVAENNANYSSADGVLFNKDKTELICFLFEKTATSYEIPSTVKSICDSAFEFCENIESITFAEGSELESIGSFAFNRCTNLASVTFAAGSKLESIGFYAFVDCNSLASIIIPDSVTSIGDQAFLYCTNLASVTFAEGSKLESLGASVFMNCGNLASITIPDCVTSIDGYAFCDCGSLESINIPASVTSIGDRAFYNTAYYNNSDNWTGDVLYIDDCLIEAKKSITSCNIEEGTRLIADYAFYGCENLATVNVPDSVTSIGLYAFRGTAFDGNLPDGLTYLGKVAYKYKGTMPANTALTLNADTTQICSYAFENCTGIASITVPASVTSIGNNAFDNCANLAEINVAENNANYSSADGVLFNKDKTELICFPAGKTATSYEIPSTVKSICDSAFAYCENIESITFAEGSKLESIGNNAFNGCTNLASVTFAEGSKLKSIGNNAFYGCTNLASVTFAEGSKLDSIGSAAFCECTSLESITIPASVTSIGEYAFYNCSALSDVYYGGDESDRDNIVISENNEPLLNAAWHYSVRVTGVALDITSKTLTVGATQQLAASVAPTDATNKKVTWESSDTAIATVDANGLVTAKAGGTATITVTTADGNKTATCAITVAYPTVSINNNPGTKTINYGEELKLTATVTNRPVGGAIVWYVNGTEKGRGEEFTAPAGTADYTVTVKLVDKDGSIIKDAENKEITAEEKVTVKAGFFQKLINFFKNLFGAIRIVPQAFKQF